MTESSDSLRVGRLVAVLTTIAAVLALFVVLLTLITDRPVHWAHWLLWPGIPILVLGQLWAMALLIPRERGARDPLSRWWSPRYVSAEDSRRLIFVGLPRALARALATLFVLLWLTAGVTFFSLLSGGPGRPSARCPYRLVDHGDFTCVSHHTYVHVGAAENRFVAAVLGGFFVLQSGVAAGEVLRRRRSKSRPEEEALAFGR
jgi:hypothetical protein